MKLNSSLLAAGGLSLIAASALGITNLGFETGDFTGWTVTDLGHADVVNGHSAVGDPRFYAPQEGEYFARLSAGLGVNTYTTITQSFHLNAGETISGSVAFDAADELPDYNDNAFLKIQSTSGTMTLWTASVSSVGSYNSTPWEPWTFTALTSDTYVLTLGVANQFDNDLSSLALLDLGGNITVPDNGAMLSLLGISLIGLFALRNKSFGLQLQ